ncbi:MAG: 50S ribosomal protein L15e [Candidatus Woesearchaeota archaeon]
MGVYKYLQKLWKQPKKQLAQIYKEKLVEWRRQPVTVRVMHPTRLDRARALGFKAKQGYFVVRQRVSRGGREREQYAGGRRSKNVSRKQVGHISYQTICEQRAQSKFVNCQVLNSYWVGEDGKHVWYEVILVDPHSPSVQDDKSWLKKQRGRVQRGLTSSAKKSRGLRKKGIGAENVRPSIRANKRKLH